MAIIQALTNAFAKKSFAAFYTQSVETGNT